MLDGELASHMQQALSSPSLVCKFMAVCILPDSPIPVEPSRVSVSM